MNKICDDKKENMKKGFTFAELMISLVIIAVITAILYPTISEIAPNNNKQLFKSAYKTVETLIQDTINESDKNELFDSGDANRNTALCELFKDKLNTVNEPANPCTDDTPWFTTSNGMRWYFTTERNAAVENDDDGNPIPNNIGNDDVALYIDVNASNNDTNNIVPADDYAPPCSDANPAWKKGCFRQADDIVRDTFQLTVKNTGKIEITDTFGLRHLLDKS